MINKLVPPRATASVKPNKSRARDWNDGNKAKEYLIRRLLNDVANET